MKATWVSFLLAVGVVAADVGLGYNYKVPKTSYGEPSYQIGGNSGQYSSSYAGSLGSGSNAAYQGTGFQTEGVQSVSNLGNGYYQSSGVSSGANSIPAYLYNNGGAGTGFQSQYSTSNQYQTAEKYQNNYDFQHPPAQVFKHFYVHSAPEEPEPPKPRTPIVLPPPQKHYKIIFVKTPTEQRRPAPIIPVQPQNEEKTIVYVLVKKPEEQEQIVVPKIEQKPPSKPEVFFIKYKNKEDSQAVINNIVKDYNGQQVTIENPSIGSDSSFNTVSGASDVVYNSGLGLNNYNTATVLNDVSFNSGAALSDASYDSGVGVSDASYNSGVGVSDASYSTSSGFGNVQYDAPAQSAVASSSSYSDGEDQGSAFSLASAGAGPEISDANISSTVASPLTVSTTASSIDYDGASAIATSQGVPHETYGPPNFRVK